MVFEDAAACGRGVVELREPAEHAAEYARFVIELSPCPCRGAIIEYDRSFAASSINSSHKILRDS